MPSLAGLLDRIETDVTAFDALRKAKSIGRPVGVKLFRVGSPNKPEEPEAGKRGKRRQVIGALSP
ncbi:MULTISPECIES: hypothetical protein [unclassified Mesorhizobium]|uniref:hypothetical protein n=1 Tax=unclassified Mesorhizobium TaxID=325217 RepID=UPI001ABF82C2|nr:MULTISPECIES: hypothetical protein [unclassified Mesorhizobium]